MWYLKLIVIVVAKDTHANVYNSYLCSSNVIAICGDFDGQPYTAEIGVAYGVLLHGLAIWLHKL